MTAAAASRQFLAGRPSGLRCLCIAKANRAAVRTFWAWVGIPTFSIRGETPSRTSITTP
jgi:hypothetical protein